jgi:hypothetical protein
MPRSALQILSTPLCMLLAACFAVAESPSDHPHAQWDQLLEAHVVPLDDGLATAVDYAGFARDREALKRYLAGLSEVSRPTFDRWTPAAQLAFLINAYNAWTVELILTAYPDLESIRDLGSLFRSPWKKSFIPLLGEERSLDDIEHGLIRGSDRYREPRIHFAVNCASIGCPALRREAYMGERLDAQLEEQTHRFLADRSRNRYEDGTLNVSSLFDWYGEDFAAGWRGADTVAEFLALYADALGLTPAESEQLRSGKVEIDFLDYDWRLNDLP